MIVLNFISKLYNFGLKMLKYKFYKQNIDTYSKENNIFLNYYNDIMNNSPYVIKNYKNKRLVFKICINGKVYFIKKYVLPGRRGKMLALGLREDKVNTNIRISKELDKIGIKHVKIVFYNIMRKTLLQKASLLVTEYGGKPLIDYCKNYKDNLDIFKNFFDTFIKLVQNNIFPDDYHLYNVVVNEKRELLLFDLDEYKIVKNFYKNKEKILHNFESCLFDNKNNNDVEFKQYLLSEFDRVKKELEIIKIK